MIEAKIIADSIANGVRLTTMQLRFHRFILPEFNTHRVFSRNASSSRAIPTDKLVWQVGNITAYPVEWGLNKSGMQAEGFADDEQDCRDTWYDAACSMQGAVWDLQRHNIHKQVINRLLEPFLWTNVIVTATEWSNFFALRDHDAAQPEIRELARCMREAMDESNPVELSVGNWHLPYVNVDELVTYEFEDLIKCSIARCARVSYLNHDQSKPNIDKDIALADKLISMGHMSPTEHQATPMAGVPEGEQWWREIGVTHQDYKGQLWSGNLRGWIQYRQTGSF